MDRTPLQMLLLCAWMVVIAGMFFPVVEAILALAAR
jgi:hypothetical protein